MEAIFGLLWFAIGIIALFWVYSDASEKKARTSAVSGPSSSFCSARSASSSIWLYVILTNKGATFFIEGRFLMEGNALRIFSNIAFFKQTFD
ncbi:hypothetical protein LC085_00220 [Bacillus tianshenii]|nr:hypothetical protein [Bacillus tianshenii]